MPDDSPLARLSAALAQLSSYTNDVRAAACDLEALRDGVATDLHIQTSIAGITLRGIEMRQLVADRVQARMDTLETLFEETRSALLLHLAGDGGESNAGLQSPHVSH